MTAFELTRALIDIDSVTPNEEQVGVYLADYLSALAARTGGHVERIEVEPHRYNVLAYWDAPVVTLSTHIDTVPPFFPSREDDEFIWGRGACDTKGIIASMIFALEALLAEGERRAALLFVVGEERNSAGALAAAKDSRGSKYVINGEPTESKLVLGSKGALRFEVVAQGKMAHSAYPHLGESAIEKLLDALERVRKIALPSDPVLGQSTLNIGTIQGGRAPERDSGSRHGRSFHSPGRRWRQHAPRGSRSRRRKSGSEGSPVHSCRTYGIDPRFRNDSGGFHHRHPRVQRGLGHAVFVRARKYPRRAHRPRAHFEARAGGGD